MSHVADCDIHIKDLDALEQALKHIPGAHLMRGQKTHMWFGRFMNDWNSQNAAANRRDPETFGKCDHAIRLDGAEYEIGLCQEADGTFTPVYDSWGDGQKLVKKFGGLQLPKLKDEYAAAVATRVMARKGFRVARTTNAKGEIVLRAVN